MKRLLLLLALAATASAQIHVDRASGELIVQNKPYLLFAGELGNSSAGTAEQADTILPRLAARHVNTVLMPVPWAQIEPVEGHFDFTILDHWVAVARTNNLHLVLLWFGSWKNSVSSYTPTWVKSDSRRFPRVIGETGEPIEILSALAPANLAADRKAFAALMHHVRELDAERLTILMVQVENEVGVVGSSRDRSPEANRAFAGPVPPALLRSLAAHQPEWSPELRAAFHPGGHTWTETFGSAAPEFFTAWNYASYIGAVAAAGKAEYPLPMYVNAQLPALLEQPGEYPSGGPHPAVLDLYRAAAPALDFFSPDIYWPEFEYWTRRYAVNGNPLFIPEARADAGPFNALYAFGEVRAFGFSPFGIEGLPAARPGGDLSLETVYSLLQSLGERLPTAIRDHKTRAAVLHATSPRGAQTVALGGYLWSASLARTWPANNLAADTGGMLILQSAPNEFLVLGAALRILARKDLDAGPGLAGIDSIEEGSFKDGAWTTTRVLNGDQSNQGRALDLAADHFALYRIRMYTLPATKEHP